MKTPADIRALAWQRLDEAEILCNNGKCDGAFYLMGYCIELLFKAKICDRLGVPNLFDMDTPDNTAGLKDIRTMVKTHNLMALLIVSGLKSQFDVAKAADIELSKQNSLLMEGWKEDVRYKPCGHMKQADVQKLMQYFKQPNGLPQWIQNN
jgi:hypothetical protein